VKKRAARLVLRWPFSRQITLSVGTLLVLLAVWWAVAAQQWISPLFLPPPGQVLAKLITIAGPQGFMDATLWQHLGASLARILVALLAAVIIGIPVGIAMGLSPTVRGILDPLIELYRPVPPLAYLPLMVIWFGIGETSKILLIYLAIFAPVACRRWRGEKRPAGADPRGAVAGCQPYAGAAVRDFTGRTAGDFNRAAHRAWRGLVHAGGGRADCRHARIRIYGAVGGRVPGD
jgi:hypothetical protein